LARIEEGEKVVEVRSPLPGRIRKVLKGDGAQVAQGEEVLSLNSDENSVWEALRGLSLIGTAADVPVIESYAESTEVSTRVRDQAKRTLNAAKNRPGN